MSNNSDFDIATCSVSTCPIETSYYGYVPNLGINIFFAIVYGLIVSTCILFLPIFLRSWIAYTTILGIGAAIECTGYILRACGSKHPWDMNSFIIQYVFLTIAPIFMSASVYLSIEHIAQTIGRGFFNINPNIYPRIFILSDVIALVVQSIGGAMSANTNPNNGMPVGVKITIVGLVLQLVSLCVFSVLLLAIILPNRKATFNRDKDSLSESQHLYSLRHMFVISGNPHKPAEGSPKNFVIVVMVATTLIVIRSAYRVAELSKGLQGGLETNQWAFMIMDGLLILISSSLLAWGHPNLTLP